MTDKETLIPIEEKTIVFYDDKLQAVRLESGEIFVPVRRLCDNLGLDWSGQRQRINRHPVLKEAIRGVGVITTPQDAKQHGGRKRILRLPLNMVPGRLFLHVDTPQRDRPGASPLDA